MEKDQRHEWQWKRIKKIGKKKLEKRNIFVDRTKNCDVKEKH